MMPMPMRTRTIEVARRCPKARLRGLALAWLLGLPALSACAGVARPVEPVMVGREDLFTVEWEVTPRGDRSTLRGSVTNGAVYPVKSLYVLVEGLDGNGAIVTQEVTEVASHLGPATRSHFEMPARVSPRLAYRVRVYAYDVVDGCGN